MYLSSRKMYKAAVKKLMNCFPYLRYQYYILLMCFMAEAGNVQAQQGSADTSWNALPTIISRIQAPSFPDRDINIVSIGAPINGTSLATSFIQKAIDSCNALGGGRVIIPAGNFLTGAITMKSNVNLYIAAGAVLKFSTNTANYLPVVLTRFEGVECYNFSPFIYSYNAENIAVTGPGTLNGQASYTNWWAWKTAGTADVDLLNTMGENGTPVANRLFGSGHKLRPVFIQFYNSRNILIDSITIINSPMWEINPVLSQNITVSNIHVNSYGPNNDGCNPECSKDVLIYKCFFNTGDDCIAIKSGRNNDGRRVNVPSENIVIQQCTMQDGHGGVTMGSECSGNIRNVFAEDCNMSSPNLDVALRIKTNSVRGGIIENIFMRNCTIGQVSSEVIQVQMNYQEGDVGAFTPVVRNISINNVTCNSSLRVFRMECYQRSPVTDIRMADCTFNNAATGILTNVCRLAIYNSFINGNIPLIPAAIPGYTEAELYNNKFAWGWSNVVPGFNGNGYMECMDPGNSIEWTVTKSQAETDTLSFRYANKTLINKPATLWINNTRYGQFAFPPTQGAWAVEKKNIELSPGINTIRLETDAGSPGANIDRFSLQPGNPALCAGDDTYFTAGFTGNYAYQWQVSDGDSYTAVTDDAFFSGTATDTLRLLSPPTSWYGKNFRCRATNLTDTVYSNINKLKFTINWTGVIDDAWENPANWSCGQVPDANTDVIINGSAPHYPAVNNNTACHSILLQYPAIINLKTGILLNITGLSE